jgi:hypothetical protein
LTIACPNDMRPERRQALSLQFSSRRCRRFRGYCAFAKRQYFEPGGGKVVARLIMGRQELFSGTDAQPTGKNSTGAFAAILILPSRGSS